MCIEYDRTPIDTNIYLSVCLHPLNAIFFCSLRRSSIDRGVGVGVKAISLAPLSFWADTISYFLSHIFHIIDPNTIFCLSCCCCCCCCCCFFVVFFVIFSLLLLVSSLIVMCSAIKNYILVPGTA